jgi:hypothetical protein
MKGFQCFALARHVSRGVLTLDQPRHPAGGQGRRQANQVACRTPLGRAMLTTVAL